MPDLVTDWFGEGQSGGVGRNVELTPRFLFMQLGMVGDTHWVGEEELILQRR